MESRIEQNRERILRKIKAALLSHISRLYPDHVRDYVIEYSNPYNHPYIGGFKTIIITYILIFGLKTNKIHIRGISFSGGDINHIFGDITMVDDDTLDGIMYLLDNKKLTLNNRKKHANVIEYTYI